MEELTGADAASPPFRAMYHALIQAHHEVERVSDGGDMGTTAVVAWCTGDQCWWGWVGDSRLYHIREGVVLERSIDHTHVNEQVASGLVRPEDAADHPDAHVLSRALGAGGDAPTPTVYEEPLEVLPGDVILLCSDGLHDLASDAEIATLADGTPAEACAALLDVALKRGAHDNITLIVARYMDVADVAEPVAHDAAFEPLQSGTDAARHTVASITSVASEAQRPTAPASAPPDPTTNVSPTPTSSGPASLGMVFIAGLLLGMLLGGAAVYSMVGLAPHVSHEVPAK
jgi:hypothetical protein